MFIRKRREWEVPESAVTPEAAFWNRRRFLKRIGFGLAGTTLATAAGWSAIVGFPARRNPRYHSPDLVPIDWDDRVCNTDH